MLGTYSEGILTRDTTCAKNAHTTPHGALKGKTQTNVIEMYNLDVIISVGYRVKSQRGTQFRIWTNFVLKDYLIKGYAVKSDLFGHEKNQSFHSSIGQIYQTWDGKDLYPSVEEKTAMLLYLVVKNHSFTDGNKRIAATLFLWFMESNHILYAPGGHKRIADNALVALTLMIAESKTDEMDIMVKVVVNLINGENQ